MLICTRRFLCVVSCFVILGLAVLQPAEAAGPDSIWSKVIDLLTAHAWVIEGTKNGEYGHTFKLAFKVRRFVGRGPEFKVFGAKGYAYEPLVVKDDGTVIIGHDAAKLDCERRRKYKWTFRLNAEGAFEGHAEGDNRDCFHTYVYSEARLIRKAKMPLGSIPAIRLASRTYRIQPGGSVYIHGIKKLGCRNDGEAPSFEEALRIAATKGGTEVNQPGGTLYDAGIGKYYQRKCKKWFQMRGIGFRANPDFRGTISYNFWRQTKSIVVE